MRGFTRTALAAAFVFAAAVPAIAQTPGPACQQLEAQLTSLDRGNADPARAEQIRRAEDALNRQQYEVDRLVAQARRMDCDHSGFFSIFRNPPPACGPLNQQVDQARSNLDRMQMQLEQLQGGTTQRAAQRQSLLIALGQNNCGPQYRSAALQGQRGGFFDRLFGGFGGNNDGGVINAPENTGPMGSTYRTLCVRVGDGFYYPISYATTADHFQQDDQTCHRTCPAAEVQLFVYHNPGEDVSQSVSLTGTRYADLPSAFAYRKKISGYSCRPPGESWAEALRASGPDTTLEAGDVVVTEQNAKRLSQPRDSKQTKSEHRPAETPQSTRSSLADAPGDVDPAKRKVRTVGPTFLPAH
jgi:hypothetical protein